uniref:Serpentine receptor class gamma n=1 Tax=Caenorhabditis japonica TaxID=281687 RepID=A0A8R1HKW0_CAEJA
MVSPKQNVALFLIDFLFTRLPISGLVVDLPYYLPRGLHLVIIYFLSYYLIYANFYSVTLICLNRMSSVLFPYACNAFWQRFVGVAIAMVYILPLITTWQMLTYSPYFLALYENRSNYQMVYDYTTQLGGFLIRSSTALCVTSAGLSLVCVIANILTIVKYKKTVQMMNSGQNMVRFFCFFF